METQTATAIVKSLYQCQELVNQIETEDGEISEEQLQQLVSLHTQSIERLKSLCGLIRYLENCVIACKAEKDRISVMQKTAENRLERVKEYLIPFVKERGTIIADTYTLSMRKSTSVDLEPGFNNPYFCKIVQECVPDKRAIKDALVNQEEIPGATLKTNYNLHIK